ELRRGKGSGGMLKAMRESKDPAVFTVVAEDGAALAGLAGAVLGVFINHPVHAPPADGIASIAIGLILSAPPLLLTFPSRGLLVGESADLTMVRRIRELVEADPCVARAGSPLTMHLGPDQVLLNLGVVFRPELTVPDLAQTIERIEKRIKHEYPDVK